MAGIVFLPVYPEISQKALARLVETIRRAEAAPAPPLVASGATKATV